MVRIDVFFVEGEGYYFIPIYVADTLKADLPNRACVAHKPFSNWKPMDPNHFVFSLYPNDLVYIRPKSGLKLSKINSAGTLPDTMEKEASFLYFVSANISSGSIFCKSHDNTYQVQGLGIKTLKALEKYTVDVLGEYHKVDREPRLPFTQKRS